MIQDRDARTPQQEPRPSVIIRRRAVRLEEHLRVLAQAFETAREGIGQTHPSEWWVLTIGDLLSEAADSIHRGIRRADNCYSPGNTDRAFSRVQSPLFNNSEVADAGRRRGSRGEGTMSRSGYSDDCEYVDLWRGAVDRATFSVRGQRLLRRLRDALDAMPVKRLITNQLVDADGEVCALGAVDPAKHIDPDDLEAVGRHFDIDEALAAEIVYMNDEAVYRPETPGQRWARMRLWVEKQILRDE